MDTTLPSANPEEMTETIGRLFNQPHFWSRLLYAVLLLLCCMVVMRVLNALVSRTIQRLKVEKSLHTLIRATVKILLWFVTIVVVLSYLGIGLQAPLASLGTMCNDASANLRTSPHEMFIPALMICLIMFAFNFVGDGLRDALDPKLKK